MSALTDCCNPDFDLSHLTCHRGAGRAQAITAAAPALWDTQATPN